MEPSTSEARRDGPGVRLHELRAILSGHEAFAGLADATLEAVAHAVEREFVPAGHRLLTSGAPPESAYIVEHGRLHAIDERASASAGRDVSLELGRGDICGLNLLVARIPTRGHVIALRDSTVLRLRREELLRCVTAHPDLVEAQARHFYDTAIRSHVVHTAQPRILTLLPVGEPLAIERIVGPLTSALSETLGAGSALDYRRASELLGARPSEDGHERFRRRLAEWCSQEEERGRMLLLVCDREHTAWTKWCLEQTDRVVVAAIARDVGAVEEVRRLFAPRTIEGAPVAADLLLVHEPCVEAPGAMGAWLDLGCLRRHHHIRLDHAADFRRAARRIGESAVGVVLGGGGARALAHIGVLRALDDAGVPVDAIGGTSMGSVVAAGYARGLSPSDMLALFAEHVPDARALRDLDFPRVSLLAGRKLERLLQFAFEDLDVADLWLPCFCVSADLVAARMVVHDRGPLWEAIRASCSLPGIFPPLRTEGRLLVDGGTVNNVPISVMRGLARTIVAVDVGAAGIGATATNAPAGGGGRAAGGASRARDRPPSIMQILTSSTTLGSKEELQHAVAEGQAELFLEPPVQHIKLLGFEERERLFEIGYAHAQAHLAEWRGRARFASGSAVAVL